MFVERGYSAVSIRDIAAAADLTNGAVYGHFRTKGQLLVEVIRWKLAQRDSEIDFDDAAAHPVHGVALMFGEDGRALRLLEVDAAAAARHDPDVAAGMAELYSERHERIRDVATELSDPETAAWVIEALAAGIGMRQSSLLAQPQDDRLAAALLAVMQGLMSASDDDSST
jgi:AcrR family transcriptional regulator